MLARLGEALSRTFRSAVPDPFVLAVLLTAGVFVWAWAVTSAGPADLVDAWQEGFWNLLAFSMQMCLILVTGYALASSPPARWVLTHLASLPRTNREGVALTASIAMAAGLLNWGFGLIVGAILARDVADRLSVRGIAASRGLLASAGYTCMLVWHGGLSGSAPLKAASDEGQTEILGATLAGSIGPVEIDQSIFSASNYIATGGVMVIAIVVLVLMCPAHRKALGRADAHVDHAKATPAACALTKPASRTSPTDERGGIVPRLLEHTPLVSLILAAGMSWWLFDAFAARGVDALTLSSAILAFFTLGLVLHGTPARYGRGIDQAARGCGGIIIQFPLYAGIMGMMTTSGLAAGVSTWFANAAGDNQGMLATLMFVSAGIVNLFVPSGGGQWAVQGPIAMQAALEAGVEPARLLMAVAYGDQLTNMLQPFWALPLLAITGAKAGEVVGYTAVVMMIAAVWFIGCLTLLGW